jgi:hypothetical protein
MTIDQVSRNAKEDAKTGNYQPELYDESFENGSHRRVYVNAYLGAREKMGLLGKAGPGK